MGLLGYNTISLTDLTDALPASLTLSSTLNSNTQIREGEKYIPDFTKEEIIITPSLFLGGTEIDYSRYNKQVFYQCGEQDENGEKTYSYDGTELISNDIYVDRYGRLHYKKNLSNNITIEAFIKDFQDSGITYTTINVVNPITILFLRFYEVYFQARFSMLNSNQTTLGGTSLWKNTYQLYYQFYAYYP